jgi:cyclophilin family peptidyl-prolyl cis-trans isomerase
VSSTSIVTETTAAATTAATDTTAAGPATTLPTTVPGGVITGETPCPPAEGSSERILEFESAPPMCIDETKTYSATVTTNKGEFTVDLDPAAAPTTVNNFVVLARYQYFDGTVCHRIITDFVVQCGDPSGTGNGDGGRYPGYEFDDELPEAGAYQLGSLAMANAGPNTNGSQFFIITGENGAALPPSYSLFGQVTEGFDTTVKAMEAAADPSQPSGSPTLEPVVIEKVTITER